MNRGLIALMLFSGLSWADAPQLRVQARLVPGEDVVVGETLKLQVDVLTDSWFTHGATLPELSLNGADVLAPNGEASHVSQSLQGKTFSGLRYTYRITPQRAQHVSISALIVSATPAQAEHELSAHTAPLQFSARLPDGFEPGEPVLVASALRVQQTVTPSPARLQVGDSVTRTVTLQADDTPGLSLPPLPFATVEGLSAYRKTPQVSNLDDGRGSFTGGQRVDSVTYRITRAGDFELPAMRVKWWDSTQRRPKIARVPAVGFKAVAAPRAAPVFSLTEDLKQLEQPTRLRLPLWAMIISALVLIALAVYASHRVWLTIFGRARHWLRARPPRKTYALRPLNPGHDKDAFP